MGGSKLRTIHVIIIGSLACAVVIAGMYFLILKNTYKKIGEYDARLQAATAKWGQYQAKQVELENEQAKTRMVTVTYEKYLRAKMPSLTFADRTQGMIALWQEQGETLGPLLQNWPRKSGVSMSSGIQVPAAPVDQNSIDASMIRIPIGQVSVTGDFAKLMTHVRSWNNFNRLVQIDPPTIQGTSPGLAATYSVTVFIFPRGEAGPPEVMAGSSGSGVPGMAPVAPAPAPAPPAGS